MRRFLKAVSTAARSARSRLRALPLLASTLLAACGCAAVTNPVGDGVRVRHLPPELLAPSKADEQTIALNFLRQPPPRIYQLAPGDVLGVYIEGFLGDRNLQIPVNVSAPVQIKDQRRLAPSSGYPVPVQEDGTIALPGVPAVAVTGLSIPEARAAIRKTYLDRKLLRPETERIAVTLVQPRQTQVIVMRQEAQAFSIGLEGPIANSKLGTGFVLDLPGYENDVLHALAQTGGLPGFDAYNEVIIMRDGFRDEHDREAILKRLEKLPGTANPLHELGLCGQVIHIPLRQPACARMPFGPEDVILHNGDVVFLEARDNDWYYTGGLLPSGKHALPRDHDLDVVEAIAEMHGSLLNGDFGVNNLSGDLVKAGLGNPSATLLTVLRRTPGGGVVPIRVDLGRALRDRNERLLVQRGDVLILQETAGEALARYVSQTFLNFDVVWSVFRSSTATGVLDVAAPDRLAGNRLGSVAIPGGH